MPYSRRDLSLLIPALAVGKAAAQNQTLPSKTYRFEDLPVTQSRRHHLDRRHGAARPPVNTGHGAGFIAIPCVVTAWQPAFSNPEMSLKREFVSNTR